MEPIFDFYQAEKSYINWENLIIALSFVVYLVLWTTLLTGFMKKANTFIGHYARLLLIFPFWVLFTLHLVDLIYPNLNEILSSKYKKKIIQVINDNDAKATFSFFAQTLEGEWEPIVPNKGWFYLEYYDIDNDESKEYELYYDDQKHNAILMKYLPKNSNLAYGIKLKTNNVTAQIFTSNLRDNILLDFEKNHSFFYKKIIVFGLAMIFVWYHYGLILRSYLRRRYLFFASFISLICLFSIFNLLRLVFLKDIIRI